MAFRVAYFGLPLGALLLANDGHELTLVAISRRDVGLRRAERLFGDRLAYRPDVRSRAILERVRAGEPDLIVSWFWTTKLPMELVRAARLGGIGSHPSLLPRHRGPDPTYWTLLLGDRETGVSVHRLEADYDTGDVLDQDRLAVDPRWNAWQLAKALDRPSLRLLRRTVSRISRGEHIPATPQDPALVTEAPFPADADCALVWSRPTEDLLRQIRALSPAPSAFTQIGEAIVTVTHAEPSPRYPKVLEPGEGAVFEGFAIVRTGDGAIRLLAGEIDGIPADAKALAAMFS